MSHEETIIELKKDGRINKFMKQYRYTQSNMMKTDLAELAYAFYLDGYHNGLEQHLVVGQATDLPGEPQTPARASTEGPTHV